MKDCSDYQEQISQYLDGMLCSEEEEALLAHVEQCASCRLLLEELIDLSHQFHLLEVSPPASFSTTVLRKIQLQNPPRRKKQIRRIGFSTAAVICAALLGTIAWQTVKYNTREPVLSAATQERQAESTALQTWGEPSDARTEGAVQNAEETDVGQRVVSDGGKVPSVASDGQKKDADNRQTERDSIDSEMLLDREEIALQAAGLLGSGTDQEPEGAAIQETNETDGESGAQGDSYFAVVTVAEQGETRPIKREDLSELLYTLEEENIPYFYCTTGVELDPDSSYALICYLPGDIVEKEAFSR
ncbi:MAG: zf-HC2 domain-containing protein [Oscillospiraceae bacterium]|nr:zf-HC2 domain-containing protein [Oscillospiraceae bacterium]